MERYYWIYIVTDKPYGTLYIGVTNNLQRRIYEHQNGTYSGFTKKYGLKLLVYYEQYADVHDAIRREKQIKRWRREWKIRDLIHVMNFQWRDLSKDFS